GPGRPIRETHPQRRREAAGGSPEKEWSSRIRVRQEGADTAIQVICGQTRTGATFVLEEAEEWLSRRSWTAADRPLPQLLNAKRAAGAAGSISVVLPALNEEATVGAIVEALRRD